LVAVALVAVFDMLRELQESPRKRELNAQARSYDQAVKHWTAVPPTEAQLQAMFDLVTELHDKVLSVRQGASSAKTLPPPPPGRSARPRRKA
jgi:hypothetical protein